MATFVDERRRLHAADPALLAPSEAGEGPSMLDFVAAARADFEGQQHIVELAAQASPQASPHWLRIWREWYL